MSLEKNDVTFDDWFRECSTLVGQAEDPFGYPYQLDREAVKEYFRRGYTPFEAAKLALSDLEG